jgi:GalNAc-alpha-(1->4)-GalNAc-alpha-(1->3)-diNAcBac-PP-undecaprenol alpha-1,4-N-acetyl-D-galactosaminyltransferase
MGPQRRLCFQHSKPIEARERTPSRSSKGTMFSGRILMVVSSLKGGGAERVASLLSSAWAERGCDVELVTFEPPSPLEYRVHPRITRTWVRPESASERRSPGLRALLMTIREAVTRFSPDVVISFIDVTNVLTLLATLGSRVPVVVSERSNPKKHWIKPHWRLLRRLAYRRASSLVVQTESVKRWATGFLSPERVVVIQNPLVTTSPKLNRKPENPDEFTIVSVGRLSREKGFDLLLDAFARVCGTQPNCRLDILGDGPERPLLEQAITSLNIEGRVHLHGFVQDVEQHLRRADLFVLPSRYEGFPNALCEAMCAGLPVISFDCEFGPAEIIANGQNGILVSPENPVALAQAMHKLITNKSLRESLASNAQSIQESLSLEKILGLWDRVLPNQNRAASSSLACVE